jgi:hypothetical protein
MSMKTILCFNWIPYQLARGIAVPIPTIQDDILGKIRKMVTPDAGCFEYLP